MVVVKQLPAEFQVQLVSKLADALPDVFPTAFSGISRCQIQFAYPASIYDDKFDDKFMILYKIIL